MLQKTIKYKDYNGNERSKTFYFNLNKAELAEMQLTTKGGLDEMIQRIINTQDVPKLIEIFKDIILKSYGEKSADGEMFIKKDENGHKLADRFAQTEAYSELFMELSTDSTEAAAFINGIIPDDIPVNTEQLALELETMPVE